MYAKSYWASMLTWFCFCVKLRFFFFMESIKSPYNDKFEIRGFMTITRIPKTLFIQIKDGVTYLMVINQLHKVLCISSDMIQWNTSIGISMYIYKYKIFIRITYSKTMPIDCMKNVYSIIILGLYYSIYGNSGLKSFVARTTVLCREVGVGKILYTIWLNMQPYVENGTNIIRKSEMNRSRLTVSA